MDFFEWLGGAMAYLLVYGLILYWAYGKIKNWWQKRKRTWVDVVLLAIIVGSLLLILFGMFLQSIASQPSSTTANNSSTMVSITVPIPAPVTTVTLPKLPPPVVIPNPVVIPKNGT